MFKENKCTRIYYRIVQRAQMRATTRREAKDLLGYVELHHIIPKSMGGANHKENLAYLTAKEHFVSHMLLIRMVIDSEHLNSVRSALWKFQQVNSQQHRKQITAWEYEYLRREVAIAGSEMNTGKVMPARSEEYRKKISDSHKGKPSPLRGRTLPEETRRKISEKLKGRISPTKGKTLKDRTPEHTAKQAESRKGKPGRTGIPQSDKTKHKIGAANKGRIPWNKKVRPLPVTQSASPHASLPSDPPTV